MLKPRKRLTKRKLKEDKFLVAVGKVSNWINDNQKILYIGLLIVTVVVAATMYYSNSLKKSNNLASEELLKAMRSYDARDYQNSLAILNNLVETYSGTASGKVGRFYLAHTFYQLGDYTSADLQFKKYASISADTFLKAAALAGSAACMVQQQQYAAAAEYFMKSAKLKTAQASAFLLDAATNYYQAGEVQTAIDVLDQLLEEYPESPQKSDADLLKAMYANHNM
ncbi:tetratricopeptide repeat protein [candidate division KSB1 bacterium]|nr:tetratricopeptide repeat protein [candidate division KSB1 bacterium]